MGNSKGLSLLETITVVAVMGIMLSAFGFSFQGWRSNYMMESRIKEMYADLMNARMRAMERNRKYFVKLESNQYTVYEDTYSATLSASTPDGDGSLQTASGQDTQVLQKKTDYAILHSLAFGATKFSFDKNGLLNLNGSVRLDTDLDGDGVADVDPDYDCIVLFTTRVNLGKWEECDRSHDGNECCTR